jgi:hypothetical protein
MKGDGSAPRIVRKRWDKRDKRDSLVSGCAPHAPVPGTTAGWIAVQLSCAKQR